MNVSRLACALLLAAAVVNPTRAENKENNAPPDPVVQGRKLAARKCQVCHAINGRGGHAGALNGIAAGRSDDWLANVLARHHETVSEKIQMPPLSEEEIRALVAYIRTLKN